MNSDEPSVIHGLELSARCLTNQPSETNITRFFVATQSLRQENQLHYIEFDDENNVIDKTIFLHLDGEVWDLSASYCDANTITTCYNNVDENAMKCSLWKIPDTNNDQSRDNVTNGNATSHQRLDKLTDIKTEDYGKPICTQWKPIEESRSMAILAGSHILLYDLNEADGSLAESFKLPDRKGHPCSITKGRWNPHHNGKHFAVASDQNVIGWDLRSKEQAYFIESAHFQGIRDLDFNPNKMYDLVSCGDDCAIKFWDIRNLSEPIKILPDDHSHWVWGVRYNPFHDQLLLSGGSDSKVILHNQSSISSEPSGHESLTDSDNSDSDLSYEKTEIADGVIAKYDEHEDSVYAVEWSSADPWTFASLSYDGRLVVNKVPKKIKFDILL